MNKYIFYVLLTMLTLGGCGHREGVTIAEPGAYLAFGGSTAGAMVKIDEDVSFILGEGKGATIHSDTGQKETRLAQTHYRVSPGKHRIQVIKNGIIVVDREILLGDGITREISVP